LKIKTKDLALTTMFAALYAVLVIAFLPTSFLPTQFRVAGVLRPGIAKKWVLVLGYGIGVVVANVFGQFVGPWDLVFMPVMSVVAGLAGYFVAKAFNNNYFIAGAVIATITSLSLSFMFSQLGFGSMIVTWPLLFIGEQAVNLIGSFVFKLIETRFKWWQA
jgi:uncharacterized membrane protein